MNIPEEVILQTLHAMYFTFAPYLDYEEHKMEVTPWIQDLIIAYNAIIDSLPEEFIYKNKIITQ